MFLGAGVNMAGFERRHEYSARGHVSLIVMSREAHLSCTWPLDSDRDEWFEFEATIPVDTYQRCLDTLSNEGTAVFVESDDQFFSLIARPNGRIAVEMGIGTGSLRRTLFLDNVAEIDSL